MEHLNEDGTAKQPKGGGRFDYVAYDKEAQHSQNHYKLLCSDIEQDLNGHPDGRWKSLAFTKLEEFYMCVGKMIRDEQVKRNGSAELQEERGNG